jgi:hypothetical protein
MFPQLPQFDVVAMFVSQPRSGLVRHCVQPGAHEDTGNVHAPAAEQDTGPLTWGRLVQSWPQAPQLWTSLGTQAPLHISPEHPASLVLPSLPSTAAASASAPSEVVASTGGAAESFPESPPSIAGFSSTASLPASPPEALNPLLQAATDETTSHQANRMSRTSHAPTTTARILSTFEGVDDPGY